MLSASYSVPPLVDTEGYFKFYQFLINMYADYLRTPLEDFRTVHQRNQGLTNFELTVQFINPYCAPQGRQQLSLKAALDILSEIADSDASKSDLWRGDTDVRLAKLNVMAYQHPFFNELHPEVQAQVGRVVKEHFPSILKHPPGERCEDIDPLLNRLWTPNYQV